MIECDKYGISFSMKRKRVLVFKNTLRSLGEPGNVRFLLNKRDRKICVQVCEAIDRDSFVVPKNNYNPNEQYEIASAAFVSFIYKLSNWDVTQNYQVYGCLFEKNRLVEYELDNAISIYDDQFKDPELDV